MQLVILPGIVLQNRRCLQTLDSLVPCHVGPSLLSPKTLFFCLPLTVSGRGQRLPDERRKLLDFLLLFVSLCPSDGVLQSCRSSWPLLTSCKTPLFLQYQIHVIPEPFCFNNKEYYYTEHESVWKGRSCMQGLLGCLFFSNLRHPEGTEHKAGVAVAICRAASSARAGAHHPGGSQELGCRDKEGLPAETCRDKHHFLHAALGHPPQDPKKLQRCWCLSVCGRCKGYSHYVSTLDAEWSLEVALPWWELGALATTCVLMLIQKCPDHMTLR